MTHIDPTGIYNTKEALKALRVDMSTLSKWARRIGKKPWSRVYTGSELLRMVEA